MENPNVKKNLFDSYLFSDDTPNLSDIINNAHVGIWEISLPSKLVIWSVGFYKVLGYEPAEIECSLEYFINHLIYYEDKLFFLSSLEDTSQRSLKVYDIRLLTKVGYQWYQCAIKKYSDEKLVGTLINIHQYKLSQFQLAADNIFINETNKLVSFGRWEISVATNKIHLSRELSDIFEFQQTITDLSQFIELFLTEYKSLITNAIRSCTTIGRPFELEAQLKIGTHAVRWVKLKAVAEIDRYGKCVIVKGIVQDISNMKQNETDLQSSLNYVNKQNKRLENFAHIVSHNLRSYVGNLQIMVNLHKETQDQQEKNEIFAHIETISITMGNMIKHLNEIVQIDADKKNDQTLVVFEMLLKSVINALQANIQSAGAIVTYDFTSSPTIHYLPAYLESIFHNLLSNAIKYRHPGRVLMVKFETRDEKDGVYLVVEDNGLGIDLDKFGDKVFGMYQTFHRKTDSQGIGLYITRNQVEALGGTIKIESVVNKGTRFIIKLQSIQDLL